MKKVLTIAGSDSSGGAGIQADLKTFAAHNVYGMSAITAITAQNTQGVIGIENISTDIVEKQIDAIFQDIVPDAIKIGMVSSSEIIKSISKKLKEYNARNIVLDPVMVATSGSNLMESEASKALVKYLFPIADLITPNIDEAEALSKVKISNRSDMELAARTIGENSNIRVLVKGGHLKTSSDDILYDNGNVYWYKSERVDNKNTHGTGCTLSSAIAVNLAKGYNINKAIEKSKEYITGAIKDGLDIGKGRGPLNHLYKCD